MEQRKGAFSARHGQEKENSKNSILFRLGYHPTEDGLWRKSDMIFARGAALRYALREIHERGRPKADEEA
jgi:hypothetical protein